MSPSHPQPTASAHAVAGPPMLALLAVSSSESGSTGARSKKASHKSPLAAGGAAHARRAARTSAPSPRTTPRWTK